MKSLVKLLRKIRGLEPDSLLYEELRSFTAERTGKYLDTLLSHAKSRVPYYRSLIEVDPDLLRQFERFPLLDKGMIRENYEKLQSTDLAGRKPYLNSSGGSTGQPVTLVQDRMYRYWSIMTENYYYEWFLDLPDQAALPKVILWGSERDLKKIASIRGKIWHTLHGSSLFNSFKMQKADFQKAVATINRRQPAYLKGYAGSLYNLAKYIKENNLRVYTPRAVVSAAESLRPFMRAAIEEAFRTKVFDFYGSREVGPMAGECVRGKMHCFQFNNFVEVLDRDNRKVKPGEEGRLVITGLHNFSMPLIRYDIGDTAVPGRGCDCGSALPTLEKLTGRITDHFVNPAGDIINGEYFTHLFYYRTWVAEFQVLQVEKDHIKIYYVPGGKLIEAEVQDINKNIRLVMGDKCRIEWLEVAGIPPTPQGKHLFTRNLLIPN